MIEQERRDTRYPCRFCACPGFGYEYGDHPGICYCRHDDQQHVRRKSPLRPWLRRQRAQRFELHAATAGPGDPLTIIAIGMICGAAAIFGHEVGLVGAARESLAPWQDDTSNDEVVYYSAGARWD